MKSIPLSPSLIKKAPQTPGIYIFRNKDKIPIYVGMSKNLKSRLSSYFSKTLTDKTKRMMFEAKYLSWIRVSSEFEALLLEAKLVRQHMPLYNIQLKDDKTPLYIGITKEVYPRVITFRQSDLASADLKWEFGPFVDGRSAKRVLKLIRKIFPFSTHKPQKKPCIYSQIGLCSPCPSAIENEKDPNKKEMHKQYLKNVNKVRKTLTGQLKTVRRELEAEMNKESKAQNFEKASQILKQIKSLDYINTPPVSTEVYLKDPNLIVDIRKRELKALKNYLSPYLKIVSLKRIECFDIAHLAGTYPTASMVTFINAEADKTFYRHFRVSREKLNNDPMAMAQVLKRRQKYYADPEKKGWGKPDLIIVDGGKGQVSEAIKAVGEDPLIIGLAKKFEQIIIKTNDGFEVINVPPGPALNLLKRIRDESHRFARRYHHKLVEKAIRES